MKHLDRKNPTHWVFWTLVVLAVPLTPIFILAGPPGWFVGIFYFCILADAKPDSLEDAHFERNMAKHPERQARRWAWEEQQREYRRQQDARLRQRFGR